MLARATRLIDGNLLLAAARRVLKVAFVIIGPWIQKQTKTKLSAQERIRFMNSVSRIHTGLSSPINTESSVPHIELLANICLLKGRHCSRKASPD